MQPLPSNLSSEDLDQWTRGCLVAKVSDLGVTYALGSGTTGGNLLLHLVGRNGQFTVVDEARPRDVRLLWPMCGSVNLLNDRFAVHAQRVVRRQWRRSLTPACLQITVPRERELDPEGNTLRLLDGGGNNHPLMMRILLACAEPTYYPPDVARRMVSTEHWHSVAINPNIILVGDQHGKLIYYYRGIPAAYSLPGGGLAPVTDCRYLDRIRRQLKGAL